MTSPSPLPPDLDITAADAHAVLVENDDHVPYTIIDLLDNLPWFQGAADWSRWRAFLKAVYGLGSTMTREELQTFRECTGRRHPPEKQVRKAWCACGRRARKSAIGGLVGVYQATRRDYRKYLAPGEVAAVLVMSKDKDDAQQIHNYQKAILDTPAMRHHIQGQPMVERTTLTRNMEIRIRAAGATGGRVRACVCALLDEIAFFPTEDAANPDREIIKGIIPSFAGKPDTLLLSMSSPFAKRGELYEAYVRLFGTIGDGVDTELFWKSPTVRMNPDPMVAMDVQAAYDDDPLGADTEFGANFRPDKMQFVDEAVLKACTETGVHELEAVLPPTIGLHDPEPILWNYHGFVDTSGGSDDWMCCAVAHWDYLRKVAVLDAFRIWQPGLDGPFNPKIATEEAANFLRVYGLHSVSGDAYGSQWVVSEFSSRRITYGVSEKTKHQIYKDFMPTLNHHGCRLLDVKVLFEQLKKLERRVTPNGQERIDHPADGKDDVANACCGALELAVRVGRWQNPPKADRRAKDTQEAWGKEISKMEKEARGQSGHGDPFNDRFTY